MKAKLFLAAYIILLVVSVAMLVYIYAFKQTPTSIALQGIPWTIAVFSAICVIFRKKFEHQFDKKPQQK